MEAADDICYHVIDIEDGFKTGVVDFSALEGLHRPFLEARHLRRASTFADLTQRASYFRAVTIDRVIRQAVAVFEKRYESIMNATFDAPLLAHIDQAGEFAAFKALAQEKVYYARPVVEVKACGFEVIGGLLEVFLNAIEEDAGRGKNAGSRSRTLLHLMPKPPQAGLSPYQRALIVTDFISGMTDSYAVELYQRIRGITLP